MLADGFNSILAAVFGTFPNTTFSQNNAVIRLTGVASRFVAMLIALVLVVLGTVPLLAGVFQLLPPGVLHAATGFLFALIAWTGLRLLRSQPNRRRTWRLVLGCSLLALALRTVPPSLAALAVPLPPYLALLLSFPVATVALAAITWEWLTPEEPKS